MDWYAHCENACSHDLALGVLIKDLRKGDGPFPARWSSNPRPPLVLNTSSLITSMVHNG